MLLVADDETYHGSVQSQTRARMMFHYRSSFPPVDRADGLGNFATKISDSLAQSGYGTIGRFFFGIPNDARLFDDSHFLVCASDD